MSDFGPEVEIPPFLHMHNKQEVREILMKGRITRAEFSWGTM